jgi:hypothetical protein
LGEICSPGADLILHAAELSVAEFVNGSVCSECGTRWPNISISLEPARTRGARMGYSEGRE